MCIYFINNSKHCYNLVCYITLYVTLYVIDQLVNNFTGAGKSYQFAQF